MMTQRKIVAYNYFKDTRYGDNIISSHNGKLISSINIQTLSEIFKDDKFEKRTHIFINEAQFFPDLKDTVIRLVEEHNKHVAICGLDSDFKREKFGQIWDLIPYADKVTKLYGKCNNCDNKSLFTHRISCEKQQKLLEIIIIFLYVDHVILISINQITKILLKQCKKIVIIRYRYQ